MQNFRVFYYKIYLGVDELNHKKHTITKDQVEPLVSMMNSESLADVDMAIKILSNSNCNQYYDDVVSGVDAKWMFRSSKDGVNKRITRLFIP